METLKSGDTLGLYTLVEKIGEGNFGIVLKAECPRDPNDIGTAPRLVAIKVPKNKVTLQELTDEVNRWEKIPRHDNILRLIEAKFLVLNGDPTQLVPALVSEFADKTLTATVGTVSWQEATALIEGILVGLGKMHRAQLVHRDLKPGNIVVIGGVPKIMDFGLSREQEASLIETMPAGTPLYMAPEVFKGERSFHICIFSIWVE